MFPTTIFFYLLLLLLPSTTTTSASNDPLYVQCDTNNNFTANSIYQSNLDAVLSSLNSSTRFTNYFVTDKGQPPDAVYSHVLCRGDVELSECTSCSQEASRYTPGHCGYSKAAISLYDFCLFRYSDLPFFDTVDNEQMIMLANVADATNPAVFMELVREILNATADWAAYKSNLRYATGELNKSSTHLYALLQCTPNLSGDNCSRCLRKLFDPLPDFLAGKIGGRVLGSVCTMRYEVQSFYSGVAMVKLTAETDGGSHPTPQPDPDAAANTSSTSQPSQGRGKKKNVAVYIVVPLVTAAALFVSVIIFIICIRRKRKSKLLNEECNTDDIDCAESLLFDLSALQDATANFHEENKLGEGGFGQVYKGVLPDRQEIAVKRLAPNSWQGLRELKNELVLVAKVQHRNLVRLLGVCLDKEKMIVYEFVPNGSLDTFLQDPARREQLHWNTRFRIICGIAQGLQYLHDESRLTIVHRDLKASNILLDANMNPKIADFGLARLFVGEQTHKSTSRIVGTFGYMAPEYVMHGQFSFKSDVFSFGVLVLEIITGRKSSGFQDSQHSDLLSFTWKNWINGTIVELLDRSALGESWPRSEVLRCIQIGLLCVDENPSDRPNMSTVVLALSSSTVSLRAPSRPAFWTGTRSFVNSNVDSFQEGFQTEVTDRESSSSKLITTPSSLSSNEQSVSKFDPR